MAKRHVIIDCDPGIDDAVMLALAFSARDELDILAIATVAGNVPLELTARNARILRELAGREDVPVYAGCARPLVREPKSAEEFHGKSGLEGLEIFDPKLGLAEGHSVDAIIGAVQSSVHPVKLVVTGPLTNVALAFALAPDIGARIDELVIMGGADTAGGNITDNAEYNFWADPHAAKLVFDFQRSDKGGFPVTVISLDFTHTVRNEISRIEAARKSGGRLSPHVATFMESMNRLEQKYAKKETGPLHDPCTIAYVLAPDLFEFRSGSVEVVSEQGDYFGHSKFVEGAGEVKWAVNNKGTETSDAIYQLLNARIGAYV